MIIKSDLHIGIKLDVLNYHLLKAIKLHKHTRTSALVKIESERQALLPVVEKHFKNRLLWIGKTAWQCK